MDVRTIKDIESERVVVRCAQSDLYRFRWIDKSLFRRVPEHRAVIDPAFFVFPGVAVCVKVQQR